jgi:hypothetical protein
MTMMTQLQSACSQAVIPLAEPSKEQSVVSHLAGRLIQGTLALYLLPALLVVLVVGGVGILILRSSELLTGPIERLVDSTSRGPK